MTPSFNLADYEPVEERIARFYNDHGDGSIETWVEWADPDYSKVLFGAKVLVAGVFKASGFAFEILGSSPVNKTSHIENCETSAIGRALANAGYAPKGQRPSREEMAKVSRSGAAGRSAPTTTAAAADGRGGPGHLPAHTPVDIGTAQIRSGPGSVVIPFGKYNGKTIAEIGVGDRKYVHYLSDKASRGDVKAAATAWLRETA